MGWEKWVGDKGIALGLDRFGASAPYKTIYQNFNLTADNVVTSAMRMLEKK
jgi:transketolase